MGLFNFIANAGGALANAVGLGDDKADEAIKAEVEKHSLDVQDLQVQVEGEKVTLQGQAGSAADLEKTVLAVGNINGVAEVESQIELAAAAEAAPEPVFYTVKSGDTLSKISKEFYGDAMRYNEIFEANRPLLSHPDKIYPGQALRIPSDASATAAA